MDRTPICSGKVRYDTQGAARKARGVIVARHGKKRGQEVKVYYCEGCAGYHFGRANNLTRTPWSAKPRRLFCGTDTAPEPAR